MSENERAQEEIERGMARSRQDDWNGAEEALRRAVTLDPESVHARYRLGWAYWRHAETEAPTLADLALGYGAQMLGFEGVARERGRKFAHHRKLLREACHWLREAIAREPQHADAHYYLAQALKALGFREEAVAMAKKASDLQPASTRYATLVQAYTQEARVSSYEQPGANGGAGLTWNDIILPPRTKRELRQMQLMLEKPDLARDLGVEPPTGILLKGAPGTGKTTVARILANEAKCRFYAITPADINQMYVGESEKRVKELFGRARETPPAIIFIDEIDALLPIRQGGIAIHSDKVVNQFLQEMDGMTPNHRVFVVGATNRPDMLDPALRRGGRLSREIEIPLPDREARLQLLQLFTRGVRLDDDVDLEKLADDTEGYSGADLRAVVNEAGLQALIRIADAGEAPPEKTLTTADFVQALENLEEE